MARANRGAWWLALTLWGAQAWAGPVPAAEVDRVRFDDAIAQALRRNLTIAAAQLDLQRAQALTAQARAASMPTLTLAGSFVRLDGDRILGTGDMTRLVAGANQLGGNLTASVPIVAPARWAGWLHAQDNQRVAEISQTEVRRTVAIATARACLQVVAGQRLVEGSEQAQRTAQAHSEYANQRLAGGLGNRLDAVRADSELQSAGSQLALSRSALLRSQEALGILLAADRPIDCRDVPTFAEADGLADDLQGARDGAVEPSSLLDLSLLRGDLRLWQARAWAAARVVRHGWTDFLPQLNFAFAPFYQDPPSITQPQLGWQARLDLTWALFDGGLRYGVRAERWTLYHQTKNSQRMAQLQARSDVRTAAFALRQTVQAGSHTGAAARFADEASTLSMKAYRAGISNNLAVIDAERRARDAGTAAAQAEDAMRQARLDLLIAAGRFPAP